MKIHLDPIEAEAVPDGTFGGSRPTRAAQRAARNTPTHTTTEESS